MAVYRTIIVTRDNLLAERSSIRLVYSPVDSKGDFRNEEAAHDAIRSCPDLVDVFGVFRAGYRQLRQADGQEGNEEGRQEDEEREEDEEGKEGRHEERRQHEEGQVVLSSIVLTNAPAECWGFVLC